MILVLIATVLLVACSSRGNSSKVLSGNSTESSTVPSSTSNNNEDSHSDIMIQSPMTLSNNALFHINGENQYLRLKMAKGKYYEDWLPGAYMGTIWEGDFIFELADDSGNTIAQTDLNKFYKDPLTFNSSFQIQFDDYNNDGDIDFTIGQYTSSNGNDYRLFTMRKGGKIEELPVQGFSSLFISNSTGFYSIKLTKVDNSTFKKEYYDNSKGMQLEDIFKWDGNEFVKIR